MRDQARRNRRVFHFGRSFGGLSGWLLIFWLLRYNPIKRFALDNQIYRQRCPDRRMLRPFGVKREAGANPARSRHCEPGTTSGIPLFRKEWEGEEVATPGSQETCLCRGAEKTSFAEKDWLNQDGRNCCHGGCSSVSFHIFLIS
jgi:hypothetical protein